MSDIKLFKEAPPDTPVSGDRVQFMRERYESFKKSYECMLDFCSRITRVDKDSLTLSDLNHFNIKMFNENRRYIENASWPVGAYLNKITELEKQLTDLQAENKRLHDLRQQLSTLRAEKEAMEKEVERLREALQDIKHFETIKCAGGTLSTSLCRALSALAKQPTPEAGDAKI